MADRKQDVDALTQAIHEIAEESDRAAVILAKSKV